MMLSKNDKRYRTIQTAKQNKVERYRQMKQTKFEKLSDFLCKLFNSTEQSKAGELNPNTVSVIFYHPETHKIQENYGIAGVTQEGAYKFLLMGAVSPVISETKNFEQFKKEMKEFSTLVL